ncbi:serine/threonine protein kinase [Calothrix sp. 336/3]|uniref:serine/threonine protein kinase n=1 Tax=Calothrix sp. 336/3 TaxID=1337936 RepID=UPI0004E41AD0|nr:serine/threonine-protein kinase [Calothrix sp. 336/3]AKG21093.1 hypothetical protein IJ00_07100 [Calothrix sp. 336/3]
MLEAEQILQNRYQLQRKLGDNGVRQTWLAQDLQANDTKQQQVVVKLLAFGGTVQWDDLKLFEREAQILQQLDHPRIPQYVDYFCIDDRNLWFGLVQAYIPGASLKEKLAQGQRFTEKQVRQIAIDILNILIHLHELNPAILHRDIKPSNLLWTEDEQIYLVDFGAVQDKAAKEGVTFTVVGTYGYAPMEQFGGRAVAASDIYALGATLIHLLTGISPAELPQKDMRIQFHDKVNGNSAFVKWLSEITEPSVERRISTAREALDALKNNRTFSTMFRQVQKPRHSQVMLNKSDSYLSIKLPKQPTVIEVFGFSMTVLFLVLTGFVFLAGILAVLLFAAPLFALGLLLVLCLIWWTMLDGLLLSAFAHQRVYITKDYFSVELWLFNFCRNKIIGNTHDIQDVFQSVMQLSRKSSFQIESCAEKEMVTIQTEHKRYSFGMGLSAMECVWLANEIKDWLR